MIGVLGLQGDFHAHRAMLERAGATVRVVKKPEQLAGLSGLVIPGGESTTLIKLMETGDFWEPIKRFVTEGRAILGTCAGMILLAKEVLNPPQPSMGLIDLSVERNSYGRQRESFEAEGTFAGERGAEAVPMVFIRAPRIVRRGSAVKPIAFWNGECVAARQGRVIVASFHPELTESLALHSCFLRLARLRPRPLGGPS